MTTETEHNRLIELTEHFNKVKDYHKYYHNFDSIGRLMDNNKIKKRWCKKHLKGEWHNYFNLWFFEKNDDYTLFLLRWS